MWHEGIIFKSKQNSTSSKLLNLSLDSGELLKNIVYQATLQKHLGILLDNRLSFEEHLRLVFGKINKP